MWFKCSCVPPCGVQQHWRRHQRAGSELANREEKRTIRGEWTRRSVKTFLPQRGEEERGRQRRGERQAERKTAKRSGWRLKNAEISSLFFLTTRTASLLYTTRRRDCKSIISTLWGICREKSWLRSKCRLQHLRRGQLLLTSCPREKKPKLTLLQLLLSTLSLRLSAWQVWKKSEDPSTERSATDCGLNMYQGHLQVNKALYSLWCYCI